MPRGVRVQTESFTFTVPTRWGGSERVRLVRTLTGSGRNQKTTWQKAVNAEIEMYGTPEEVIARIAEAAKTMTDATMDKETYQEPYDDSNTHYSRVVMNGLSDDVTQEEIDLALATREQEQADREERQRRADMAALERIRRTSPDLLANL